MKFSLLSGKHLTRRMIIQSKKVFCFLLFLFLSILLQSCSTVYIDATKLGKDVALTDSVNRAYTIIKHFSQERKAYFIILGLFKLSNPEVIDVLSTEIAEVKGDAVINTKLEVEYDLIDTIVPYGIGAVGWALLGPAGFNFSFAFNTQTYRISDDVVRYIK